MAEENHQDGQHSQPHTAGEHKEEKKKGTLESVVDELSSFAKKAVTLGAIAVMPFAYSFIDPNQIARAQVYAYTLTAGKATANMMQDKPALENTIKESVIGTALSYPISKTFSGLNQLEERLTPLYGKIPTKLGKMAAWSLGAQPAIITAKGAMTYGIGKKFRENWWPSLKNGFKYLALPAALNVGFLYQYGLLVQMAVSGTLSFMLGLTDAARTGKGSMKNLYKKINPAPYFEGGISVTGNAIKNIFKGVYEPFYALGSSANDYTKKLYGSGSKPGAANQQPAQAHGHN